MTPVKIPTYVSAMAEAREISEKTNVPVYVFKVNEGGYVVDTNPEVYSNEKLIVKLYKGETK